MLAAKYKNYLLHALLLVLAVLALGFARPQISRAADYGCGTYSAGTYTNGEGCTTTTAPGTDDDDSGGGGGLVDTGQALAIAIPAVLILAGTVLLFRTRKKMKHRGPQDPPAAPPAPPREQ